MNKQKTADSGIGNFTLISTETPWKRLIRRFKYDCPTSLLTIHLRWKSIRSSRDLPSSPPSEISAGGVIWKIAEYDQVLDWAAELNRSKPTDKRKRPYTKTAVESR
ncbi:hypothetical protein GCK32_011086 [Trichostrongylus colubriformis]|uniref:Uncharacterized protein n=1 Tax=Trichostrongylus colubriformis TaxID=6319 RepID=A0AAN8IB58_TRICO